MNYTISLTNQQATEIVKKYQDFEVEHTNNYTLFRAKYKSATLTIFKTLTMIIQGGGAKKMYAEVCELLNLEAPEEKIPPKLLRN